MDSKQIRAAYLNFFKKKSHVIVDSAPIVLKEDSTLMFTNAGMNQFKDYFLGNKHPENYRVADTQKCLRVSGKHNDLEEVGFDTYHHTMFEMLGNWSFGDYFKKEAIDWAWELLTEEFKLPKDRLYATIFEGEISESLKRDKEAFTYWQAYLPEDRILNGNKKDNFWEMGDTGPCGPCSEIHIDLRDEESIAKIPGRDLVNQDHPLVVEIWNLVFIQFNRKANGSLENLPKKHVDTGMGFERLTMALQNKKSNYDTDIFQPIISHIATIAKKKYGEDKMVDVAFRVVADHLRSVSFTIADGQLPSNTGAGYVIRRILRRAVRYGYTYLGFEEPFIHLLVSGLALQYDDVFPELMAQKDFVSNVIKKEEIGFLRTLENGLKKLDLIRQSGAKKISGTEAFELYDTYGFPLDLTQLIAREKKMEVDQLGFNEEMKKQKSRSKKDAHKSTGDWVEVTSGDHSEFLGYSSLKTTCNIRKYRAIEAKGDKFYQIVLDKTPFYAEGGGQVGDGGLLYSGTGQIAIIDTKKENDLVVHFSDNLPERLEEEFIARVDENKRKLIESNHSATHLLHAALRQVLGDHVQQRGSLVNEKILRFDFSHFEKVSSQKLKEIELIVNEKIRENIPSHVEVDILLAKAKEKGAMALFGEKYGEKVRMVTFDPEYSVELCGGTHVTATGKIGFFKILSESSIAAGVRRIEAVTSEGAQNYLFEKLALLESIQELLKGPKDLSKAIHTIIEEKNALQKEVEGNYAQIANQLKETIRSKKEIVSGVQMIAYCGTFPNSASVKQISFELKKEIKNIVLIIGADVNSKPLISVMLDDSLTEKVKAKDMIKSMSKHIKGGGGGQAFYATAGGKDISGLNAAIDEGVKIIKSSLK